MGKRSSFSPSQLHRHFLCPGYYNLSKTLKKVEGKASPAAERGVRLHDATESTLKVSGVVVFDNMEDQTAVNWCVDRVLNVMAEYPGCIVLYESQVNLDDLGIPAGDEGNRVDLLLIVPGKGVIVIDYKFGDFWVDPPRYNLQFKAYGYGAWKEYGGKWVKCIKLQPELEEDYRYMEHTFTAEEMPGIGDEIKSIVDNAKKEDAPLVRGNKQCQFCKCLDVCPQHRGMVLNIAPNLSVRDHLLSISPEDRSKLYEDLNALKRWVGKACATFTNTVINEEIEMADYHIGTGRGSRKWVDENVAQIKMKDLAISVDKDPNSLIVPEKLISPNECEKIFGKGKAVKNYMGKLIESVEGKPTIKKG